MANITKTITLDLKVYPLAEGVKKVHQEVSGLEQTLSLLQTRLATTFGTGVFLGWLWKCLEDSGALTDLLGELGSAFRRLGNVIAEAVTPALRSVLSFFTGLVTKIAEAAAYFGEILQVFFGTDSAVQSVTKSQKKLTAATKETAKAIQRSLMGFDQLNRLQKKTAGSTGDKSASESVQTEEKPAKLPKLDFYQESILWMIRDFSQDLKSIDWEPVIRYLGYLYEAVKPHIPVLYSGLKFFWKEILLPISKWVIQEAVPKFLKLLNVALQFLTVALYVARPLLDWLWNDLLQPMGQWAGGVLLDALDWLIQALADIGNWALDNREMALSIAIIVGMLASGIGQCSDALNRFLGFGQQSTLVIGQMGSAINGADLSTAALLLSIAALANSLVLLANNWDKIKLMATEAWQGVKNAWNGAANWFQTKVLDPLKNAFRGTLNGILGLVNGILRGIAQGINAIIRSINALAFTVPDWIPVLGGKTFGFQLKTVTAPQIPYLAKGAVLPANRPFLAMVGDQRHGTNVEAPLSVIQEAVAAVMEDTARANLAGQEAMVDLLSQILSAVLGIHVGDEIIARAAQRYSRKQAVMKGGAF